MADDAQLCSASARPLLPIRNTTAWCSCTLGVHQLLSGSLPLLPALRAPLEVSPNYRYCLPDLAFVVRGCPTRRGRCHSTNAPWRDATALGRRYYSTNAPSRGARRAAQSTLSLALTASLVPPGTRESTGRWCRLWHFKKCRVTYPVDGICYTPRGGAATPARRFVQQKQSTVGAMPREVHDNEFRPPHRAPRARRAARRRGRCSRRGTSPARRPSV